MNSTFSLERKLPGHASSTQQVSRKRARVGNGPTPKDASRYYHPHSTRVSKGSSSRHHKLHSSRANKTRSSRSYEYASYGRKVDTTSSVKTNSSSAVNGDTEPGEIIETEPDPTPVPEPAPEQVPAPIPEPVPATESEPLYVSELDGIPPEPGYPPYDQGEDEEPLFELPMGSSNETPADAPLATGTKANNEPTQAHPPSSGDDKELDPTNKSGTKRKRDSDSDALPVSKKGKERETPENASATVKARHRGCRGGKQATSRKISHSAGPSNGAARSECSTSRGARSVSSTKAKDSFVDTSAALYDVTSSAAAPPAAPSTSSAAAGTSSTHSSPAAAGSSYTRGLPIACAPPAVASCTTPTAPHTPLAAAGISSAAAGVLSTHTRLPVTRAPLAAGTLPRPSAALPQASRLTRQGVERHRRQRAHQSYWPRDDPARQRET